MLLRPRLSSFISSLSLLYAGILTLVLLSSGHWEDSLPRAASFYNIPSYISPHTQHVLNFSLNNEHFAEAAPLFRTVTAKQITTETLTALQTSAPIVAGPAYCNECGPEDTLCRDYGQHNLERSRSFEGTNSRIKRVLRKAESGQPIKIGILGGSVSAGHGVENHEIWAELFFQWWQQTFPHKENVFINGAVPAIETDYYASCALGHIDEDVDLVIIEMAINDMRNDYSGRTYEWLVRLLLDLPKKPAVINASVFSIHFELLTTGGDVHLPVSQHYDIPTINLRHVLLNHVLEHENLVEELFRPQHLPDFPLDTRHMNRVAHKMMTDLLIAYFQRVICRIAAENARPLVPFTSQDGLLPHLEAMEQMPRLRLYQPYNANERIQPMRPTCMSTRVESNPLIPTRTTGWSEWSWKDKKYLVGREPGDTITFSIDIGPNGNVKSEYLRSRTFGLGMVRCWINEEVEEGVVIDGFWEEPFNIARSGFLTQGHLPGLAEVTCKILEETHDPSGGHEFRLIALTSN